MATLRVTEAFAVSDSDGVQRVYAPGDLVDEKDKVVKGREHHFESVEVTVERRARMEQATAAPGEKRSLPRSKWRKAAAANQADKAEGDDAEGSDEAKSDEAEAAKPAKKTAAKKAADK